MAEKKAAAPASGKRKVSNEYATPEFVEVRPFLLSVRARARKGSGKRARRSSPRLGLFSSLSALALALALRIAHLHG